MKVSMTFITPLLFMTRTQPPAAGLPPLKRYARARVWGERAAGADDDGGAAGAGRAELLVVAPDDDEDDGRERRGDADEDAGALAAAHAVAPRRRGLRPARRAQGLARARGLHPPARAHLDA